MIRKKAARFEVKDGELHYKQKQKGKVGIYKGDKCDVHVYRVDTYQPKATLSLSLCKKECISNASDHVLTCHLQGEVMLRYIICEQAGAGEDLAVMPC